MEYFLIAIPTYKEVLITKGGNIDAHKEKKGPSIKKIRKKEIIYIYIFGTILSIIYIKIDKIKIIHEKITYFIEESRIFFHQNQ